MNHRYRNLIFCLFLAVLSMGCKKPPKIDVDQYFTKHGNKIIKSGKLIDEFPMCGIAPEVDWDAIMFVSPYVQRKELDDAGITNYYRIFGQVESMNEGFQGILFLKNKSVVAHGMTREIPFGFDIRRTENSPIFRKLDCEKFELIKSTYGWTMIFVPR